jgi:Tol biopolymer transport system component
VNVRSNGAQANAGTTYAPSISTYGRFVAFSSAASNLVSGDTNGLDDVFVHFRSSRKTSRVSVASNRTETNGNSGAGVSADGNLVAFSSIATNLSPRATKGFDNVYIRNLSKGTTALVSVAMKGAQPNGDSFSPSISADGRFVLFLSEATNLVPGGTNSARGLFVRDLSIGKTTVVSVASDGTLANGQSGSHSISADGRFVAFSSRATNLVPGDTNSIADLFVHDLMTGETTRVSVASDGSQANSGSASPSISADGRFVAFNSEATNLVPGDTNGGQDVFVHDLMTGETTRVSVASDGTQANIDSFYPSISADGGFIAFSSAADNLVPGDTNGTRDVFVHDLATGETALMSVTLDGKVANKYSDNPKISADGRFVAFISFATNLVQHDTNRLPDVFERGPLS